MFVAAAFAHIGGALGPSCAQHAVSAAHPSASVAGCAGPVPTPPFARAVVPGGAHCAAQLWCMHAPTALPCSMQAAFIMVGAHSVGETVRCLREGYANQVRSSFPTGSPEKQVAPSGTVGHGDAWASYDRQYSKGEDGWLFRPRIARAEGAIHGLVRGAVHSFRYRTVTKEGVSDRTGADGGVSPRAWRGLLALHCLMARAPASFLDVRGLGACSASAP